MSVLLSQNPMHGHKFINITMPKKVNVLCGLMPQMYMWAADKPQLALQHIAIVNTDLISFTDEKLPALLYIRLG